MALVKRTWNFLKSYRQMLAYLFFCTVVIFSLLLVKQNFAGDAKRAADTIKREAAIASETVTRDADLAQQVVRSDCNSRNEVRLVVRNLVILSTTASVVDYSRFASYSTLPIEVRNFLTELQTAQRSGNLTTFRDQALADLQPVPCPS